MGTSRAVKSARKSAPGRPFAANDPRSGRGPKKGAPNAGRPPSAVAASYRAAFDERIAVATSIADDPHAAPAERLRALDLLGKYGGMASVQHTGADGVAIAVPVTILESRPA